MKLLESLKLVEYIALDWTDSNDDFDAFMRSRIEHSDFNIFYPWADVFASFGHQEKNLKGTLSETGFKVRSTRRVGEVFTFRGNAIAEGKFDRNQKGSVRIDVKLRGLNGHLIFGFIAINVIFGAMLIGTLFTSEPIYFTLPLGILLILNATLMLTARASMNTLKKDLAENIGAQIVHWDNDEIL